MGGDGSPARLAVGVPMLLPFPGPLLLATFLRRRQRFLADVRLADGRETTAHCANTGSMRGLLAAGAAALLWDSGDPARKLPLSLKALQADGVWVGVDTQLPNRLVAAAIAAGEVPPLAGYPEQRPEAPCGPGTRLDLLLTGRADAPPCWVEVKNVTLVEAGVALFPDAVTTRGRKHLGVLADRVRAGERAAMVYLVQRGDGRGFAPAAAIDPAYAEALRQAAAHGVEVYALGATGTPAGVATTGLVPVRLG